MASCVNSAVGPPTFDVHLTRRTHTLSGGVTVLTDQHTHTHTLTHMQTDYIHTHTRRLTILNHRCVFVFMCVCDMSSPLTWGGSDSL